MDNHNIKQVTPFLMVNDIHRSLQFYVDGLGFRVLNTWEPNGKLTWCWLKLEAVSLMLQEYNPDDQRKNAPKGLGVALCFQCTDALLIYKEFLGRGLQPKEPFEYSDLYRE